MNVLILTINPIMKKVLTTIVLFLLFVPTILFANHPSYELGLSWLKKGNSIEAVKYFEKALIEEPNNAEIKKILAETHFENKTYFKALPLFENLVKENPSSVYYNSCLAYMYSFSNQKGKSNKHAEAALKLKPTDTKIIIQLAQTYYQIKHYPKAIELFSNLPINEQNNGVNLSLAKCYRQLQNYRQAGVYYKKCTVFDPTNATYQYELANSFYDNNQMAEAINEYKIALDKGYTNQKTIYLNIAEAHLVLKNYNEALHYFNEAKENDPFSKEINLSIAETLIKLERFDDARSVINKMLEYNKSDADLIYSYGMTFYKQGNTAKAERYFNDAFAINPSLKSLRYEKLSFQ